jgi:Cu/Ag efflux protein CusF
MIKRKREVFLVTVVIIIAVIFLAGCGSTATDADQQVVLEGEGILTGQIDSQSVEIEINGQYRAFALGEGVSIDGITDGSTIAFTYVEEETRPVLLSIEVLKPAAELLTGEGIFNGQMDSNSVEIEMDGEPKAFAIAPEVSLANLESGSRIIFTYREEEFRPLIISIDHIEQPVGDVEEFMVGEGVFVGQIDPQSVEIKINRAFILADDINTDGIDDGSLVAFSFLESGQRAVIESIKVVEEPVEGEVMHGIFVGQIDSQSVEIEYYQAFAIGEADLGGVTDGSDVTFTYLPAENRPVLLSISSR